MIEIVRHPRSGERFIFEERRTPFGTVYRAAGPVHWTVNLTQGEMEDHLDNLSTEAYADGEWLARELGVTR